jgi:RNA polymerase sigma factor (TIGR02999 family)
MAETNDLTAVLVDASRGDNAAAERLFPAVYDQLRALAGSYFRHQQSDHTLQATALVHEAFVKLIDQTAIRINDRTHFMAVAARAMRQVLVDHARSRSAAKRGGAWHRVALEGVAAQDGSAHRLDVLALDDALGRLAALDERQAQVVELRFFGGLSVDETAEALDVSPRTVELDWKMARAWLSRALAEPEDA